MLLLLQSESARIMQAGQADFVQDRGVKWKQEAEACYLFAKHNKAAVRHMK